MTFYERLENLRKQRNYSQRDLEKELGFSNGSISKWKKCDPSYDRLKKLADFFDVTPEFLLNGIEPTLPEFEHEHIDLISLYSKLDDKKKKAVINLLLSMVDD